MEKRPRIAGLDLVKCLAAFLVVYYHLIFPFPPDVAPPGFRWNMILYGLTAGLSICVPLFFLSTGALTIPREVNLSATLKRSGYFFFVYLFWGVVTLLFVLHFRGERMGLFQFLSTVRYMPVGYIQHLWFLPSFLMLTLLSPVFQALKRSNPKVLYFFTAVICAFTVGEKFLNECEYFIRWILGRTPYQSTRVYSGYINYFQYHYWYIFVYFVLGDWLMEHRETLRSKRKAVVAACILSLVYLGFVALCKSKVYGQTCDTVFYNYPSPGTVILASGVFLLLLWSHPGERLRRFCASVSRVSLGIYLIHWIFFGACLAYLPELMGNHLIAPFLALLIFFLSYGISLLMTKLPFVRHLIQP